MKRSKLISILFIVAFIFAISLSVSATGLEETYDLSFTVEASASTVSYGDNFQVILSIDKNPGFKNAMIDLGYDSSLVTYVDAAYTDAVFTADTATAQTTADGLRVTLGKPSDIFSTTVYDATGKIIILNFTLNEGVPSDTVIDFVLTVNNKNVIDANMQAGKLNIGCDSASVTVYDQASHVHTEEVIPGYAATCTEPGLTDGKKCTSCGEITVPQTEIAKKGHTEAVLPGVDATCEAPGLTDGIECSVCGVVIKAQEELPMAEHTWTVTSGVPATCTEPGLSDGKVCSVCGDVVEQTVLPALGHAWVDATCFEPKHCSNCGITEGTKLDHALTTLPGKDATCTESGMSAGIWCPNCETIFEKPVEIPALDHDYVAVVTEPTCLAEGYTTHTCSRCGHSYQDTPTEKVDHKPVEVPGKAPTCTATGLSKGEKCEVCDTVITEQTEIPMIAHTEETIPAKAPTCTATGLSEGKKCSVCGTVTQAQTTVEKLPHDEVIISGYAPTHDYAGLTDGKKCTVCGKITVEQTVIPALKHTLEVIPGKEATCTEPGLTEGSKCVGCCNGAVLVPQTEIPALGHDHKGVVTAPTCQAEGYTTYTCTRCGDVYVGDTTEKVAHTEITIAGTAATCTTTGLTDGSKCAVCGEIVKEQQEIAMLEHSFGEWVVLKDATATEAGSKSRECTVCHYTQTEEIPATGATEEPDPTEPATQPTEGNQNHQGNDDDKGNTVLIIAVVALFIAAAAIIVLLILKKK